MGESVYREVKCNGCTACCRDDAIFLHPEHGDIIEFYETDIYNGRYILKHKKDGSCIYLTKGGCGIHGIAPTICKEFNCVLIYKKLGYTKYRKLAKKGMLNIAVMQAAMRRLK